MYYVATDTHAMEGRGTCMTAGIKALEAKYGEVAAKRVVKMADGLIIQNSELGIQK